MKISKLNKLSVITLCTLMSIATSAQAVIVNFSLSGQIDIAESNNPFALSSGDIITASGTFDDSPIGAGETYINFSTAINNMEINIGNTVYTDSMDIYGGAYLYFFDGIFTGLDYRSYSDAMTIASSANPGFIINGGISDSVDKDLILETTFVEGSWDPQSFTITAVPVPAAVWLFGSGLIFLAGFTRRQSKS